MDAHTAVSKAIEALNLYNKTDRAQAWALIAIAEALLDPPAPYLPHGIQDAPQATHSHAQPERVPGDQPTLERPYTASSRPSEALMWNPPPLTRVPPDANPNPPRINPPKANIGHHPKTEQVPND